MATTILLCEIVRKLYNSAMIIKYSIWIKRLIHGNNVIFIRQLRRGFT